MKLKKHTSALFSFLIAFSLIPARAQNSEVIQDIHSRIEGITKSTTFCNAQLSVCATDMKGNILIDLNRRQMLSPASNMKLISSGTALHHLGSGFRYETLICHDGTIENGILKGNLHIIGQGDPTTGSKDTIATPLETTFRQWEKIIRDAGIRKIDGYVIGDGRWMDGMAEEPTWQWNDIGTYYGTGATGLMFYENMQSFMTKPGAKIGDPVEMSPSYPETPWMEFRYSCSTGEAKTGDRLYMYTSELAPIAEIRGTFGIDRGAKRVDCSNKFPEYTCAYHFVSHLRKNGMECTMGAGDYRLRTEWSGPANKKDLTLIGHTESPELRKIVFTTNHASNNLYAETLMRTLGKTVGGSAAYDSARSAMEQVLKRLGLDTTSGIMIQDGSGLSRLNLVSADFLCRFLRIMILSEESDAFMESLPSPGGDGTLYYNMSKYPLSLKSRIHAKSGSMKGTRCYSGYILPSGQSAADSSADIIVFSIMANNCTAPDWEVRPALDRIMAMLAELN